MELQVKTLRFEAALPSKAHPSDAAFDLTAPHSGFIEAGRRGMVNLGIAMAVPQGYYAQILPRSGLARDCGIMVMGGVIDSSYRGEVRVILYNASPTDTFTFNTGDRIAQMVILPVPEIMAVQVGELDETRRGTKGFGSTG